MKLKKAGALSIVTILSAGALIACGAKGPTGPSIKVSGPETQTAWLKSTLAAYNQTRKDAGLTEINFSTQVIPEGEVHTKVTDWTSGPDIFAYASDNILNLYNAGALATIPDSAADFIEEQMGADAASAVSCAGKMVSYPYAGDNGYFLYYNKAFWQGNEDKLEKIEDILDYANTKGAKVGYILDNDFVAAGVTFTFGARYSVSLNATGAISSIDSDFNTDKGIKAAKAMNYLAKHTARANIWGVAPTWDGVSATEGDKYVAMVDGSWNASNFADEMGENYACKVLPTITIDGETKHLGGFLGYKQYGVNPQNNKDNLTLKHDIAKYLVSKAVQKSRFDTFKVAPTITELAESSEVQETPHIKAILAQKPYCVAQTVVAPKIWEAPHVLYADLQDIEGEPTQSDYQALMTKFNDTVKTIG